MASLGSLCRRLSFSGARDDGGVHAKGIYETALACEWWSRLLWAGSLMPSFWGCFSFFFIHVHVKVYINRIIDIFLYC